MTVPIIPESAPFSVSQRAWLNGFFAGLLNFDPGTAPAGGAGVAVLNPPLSVGAGLPTAGPDEDEDFPWHDAAIALDDRLKLAEGRPPERVLMAAMAQLDCGSCGYLCQTYAEAIAAGEESDLTKCTPGGRETSRKLKELVATAPKPAAAGPVAAATAPDAAAATATYHRKNPFPAPLLECRALNGADSAKDTRLVALSLLGSDLTYEPGDALGVYPENDADLVESILARMGARGDEWVPIPGGGAAHAFEALLSHYDVTRVGDDFAALLARSAADPAEAATLRTLVEDDVEGVPAHWDVLDLLEQFPSARAPLAEMVAALPALQPRLYSISSSPRAVPGEVHLTVGVVRFEQGGRLRKGVASCFLGATLRPRGKARVFVHRSPNFRLPADGSTPAIMIGPGTGIAPFRAFLQERAAVGAAGPNWLFFGDQREASDFLYRDEIEAYRASGVLTRLDLAFSRDQAAKVYVQHRMLEQAAELWAWLGRGAHVYVCGDASRMALDVDHALHQIVRTQGGLSDEDARRFVKDLSRAGRYQRDVY